MAADEDKAEVKVSEEKQLALQLLREQNSPLLHNNVLMHAQ